MGPKAVMCHLAPEAAAIVTMPVSCKVDTAVLSSTRGSQEWDKYATKKCRPALTNIFIGQGRPHLSNIEHLLTISL